MEACNEVLMMREFTTMEKALSFIFNKYSAKVTKSPAKDKRNSGGDVEMQDESDWNNKGDEDN